MGESFGRGFLADFSGEGEEWFWDFVFWYWGCS